MPQGTFVCTNPHVPHTIEVRPTRYGSLTSAPSIEDMSSWDQATRASRIVFVGADGSVWVIKDRANPDVPRCILPAE